MCMQQKVYVRNTNYIYMLQKFIYVQENFYICYKKFKKYIYATKNIYMLQKLYVCYKKYMYARKIYTQGFSVN